MHETPPHRLAVLYTARDGRCSHIEDVLVIRALAKRDIYQKDIAAELSAHPKSVSGKLSATPPQRDRRSDARVSSTLLNPPSTVFRAVARRRASGAAG